MLYMYVLWVGVGNVGVCTHNDVWAGRGGHSLYIGDTCVGVGGIDLGWGRGYVAM